MKQNHKAVKIYFERHLLIAVLVLAGCSSIQNVITEDEAELLVLDNHYNHNGKTEIISVKLKNNKYYIEWEIKGNCERGVDSVNQNGEIEVIEASIC
ncbi:hypothetical protein MKX73_17610 [Solibacillus sp. FSL W7-1436]|uniref:hypothetical protein n=1 Tax=unclassified Solibacillus TaxID=2637870 RepID=UPI0030FC804F